VARTLGRRGRSRDRGGVPATASDDLAIRLVTAGEAASLMALIRRCYGDTYIDPDFYDDGVVGERLASGRLHSIGAFSTDGALVGHMGIRVRAHGGVTADAGMTLVDPDYRGRGVARRVSIGLAKQALALGLVGVHDYPVTVHAATQRLGAGIGIDTGLLIANLPADVAFQSMETPGRGTRSSSLMRWLPFGKAPARSVHLPERYRPRLEALYAEAGLSRRMLGAVPPDPARRAQLERSYDARRQILRIAVTEVGADLAARVVAETRHAADRGAIVAHADVPLSDAGAPSAVEALRSVGFSFAGLLPEYRAGDVLRLQWLSDAAPGAAAHVLATEATQAIEVYVLADRAALAAP